MHIKQGVTLLLNDSCANYHVETLLEWIKFFTSHGTFFLLLRKIRATNLRSRAFSRFGKITWLLKAIESAAAGRCGTAPWQRHGRTSSHRLGLLLHGGVTVFGCRLGMALVDSLAEAENSLNRLWQRRLSLEEPQQKIHHHRVVGHGLLDPLIIAHILTTTSFQGEKKKNENLVGGVV